MDAVIFDMDGVIIDSEKTYQEIESRMFRELGMKVSEEEHRTMVGASLQEAWRKLKERYGLKHTVDELVGWERRLFHAHVKEHGLQLMPGVRELIEDISRNGLNLAVASSSAADEIDMALRMTGLKKYFNAEVSGEHVARGKPAPDIFILASEKIGAAPDRCIVIEDSSNGVMAAKSAGMACVAYKSEGSVEQDLSSADIIIDDFACINCRFLYNIWERFYRNASNQII